MTSNTDIIHRIFEVLESKFAVFVGWMASGTMVVDGTIKKASAAVAEQGLTLADWQIIVGIIFTITMIIPKLYAGYLWLIKRIKKDKE